MKGKTLPAIYKAFPVKILQDITYMAVGADKEICSFWKDVPKQITVCDALVVIYLVVQHYHPTSLFIHQKTCMLEVDIVYLPASHVDDSRIDLLYKLITLLLTFRIKAFMVVTFISKVFECRYVTGRQTSHSK